VINHGRHTENRRPPLPQSWGWQRDGTRFLTGVASVTNRNA